MLESRTTESHAKKGTEARGPGSPPFLERSRQRLRGKTASAFFTVLALALILFALTAAGGRVSGEQFCPDLFQRRHFSYRQIPGIRIQITPLIHNDVTNELETYLSNHRYIPLVVGGKSRWDLVKFQRFTGEDTRGDAADLCAYLEQYDGDGDRKWLKWTKENPSLARVLWPAIAEAAENGFYFFCPDMMQLAESANDSRALRSQLDQMLSGKYARLADARRRLEDPTSARKLYRLALTHVADHSQALQGLAALQSAEAAFHAVESDRSR